MRNHTAIALLCALLATAASCTSNEIGNSKDVNPETIYLHYNISYNEGDDSVNCFFQFRFAGENGTTLVLNSPSGIAIDGRNIPVDSSNLSGAYYSKYFSPETFAGKHLITYTDIKGVTHNETFQFEPVHCSTTLPAQIARKDLTFNFTGILTDDNAVITVSDTSVNTDDVNITAPLKDGKITLPATALKPLTNGPITIEIEKTVNKSFQHPTQEGGRFIIYYGIKRLETSLNN